MIEIQLEMSFFTVYLQLKIYEFIILKLLVISFFPVQNFLFHVALFEINSIYGAVTVHVWVFVRVINVRIPEWIPQAFHSRVNSLSIKWTQMNKHDDFASK